LNVAGKTEATLIAAIHALVVNATGSVVAIWMNQGVEGLAWANAVSTLWQYFVLRYYLKKHAPEFLTERLLKPALQVIGGSVLLAVVAFQGYSFLHNVLAGHVNEKINLVLSMALAGGVGMALYAVILDKLGYPERDLLRDYANKFLRLFGLQLRA
jgi:Na+-driven multidrug efflux pump